MLRIFAQFPKTFDRYILKKIVRLFVKGEIYMGLGNKILELRKSQRLSQEQLAEKLNVTRQTISNWELNETSPDLNQAKELSKIFNISLDELTGNDISNIIVEKVNNTEKLAGMIIKILKGIGIAFVVLLIIDIISLVIFNAVNHDMPSSNVEESTITCSIDNNDYLITVGSDAYFNCSNCSREIQNDIKEFIDYSDITETMENIETYFSDNNGACE